VLTPVILTNVVAAQGRGAAPYVWALGAVWAADLLLLGGVALGRLRWLLRSNIFLTAEIVIAVLLNLWMSAAMPHGTLASGGHDTFWWYSISTVALWTGLRGARTGAAMVVGAAVLQLGMIRVNGSTMDPAGWMQFLFRYAWMCLAFGLAVLMMRLARQGTRMAVAAGLRRLAAQSRRDGFAVELITQLNGQLPPATSAAMLEAARQALVNAAGRSGATNAVVRAVARPDGVEVTIRDHGTVDAAPGLDGPVGPEPEVGEGLRTIGGRVEVRSAPDRGTKVTLWAPG
jgi:hypothetical protein